MKHYKNPYRNSGLMALLMPLLTSSEFTQKKNEKLVGVKVMDRDKMTRKIRMGTLDGLSPAEHQNLIRNLDYMKYKTLQKWYKRFKAAA